MNEPGLIRDLLSSARTIAVFGYSARPDRPSNSVSRTLRAHGYRVIPVNPALRGAIVDGERSYDRLVDIPKDARDEERGRYAGVRARIALRVDALQPAERDAIHS